MFFTAPQKHEQKSKILQLPFNIFNHSRKKPEVEPGNSFLLNAVADAFSQNLMLTSMQLFYLPL